MVSNTVSVKRGEQTSQGKIWACVCVCLVVLLGFHVPVWATAPIATDGAKVYEEKCASCHNGGVPRAPQLNVLRQKSAEDVLDALLTGPMTFLGMGMADAERRSVAEFISGKQLGEDQLKATLTNFCPQAPGEFTVTDGALL